MRTPNNRPPAGATTAAPSPCPTPTTISQVCFQIEKNFAAPKDLAKIFYLFNCSLLQVNGLTVKKLQDVLRGNVPFSKLNKDQLKAAVITFLGL